MRLREAEKGRGYTGSVIDPTSCDNTETAMERNWANVARETNKDEKC